MGETEFALLVPGQNPLIAQYVWSWSVSQQPVHLQVYIKVGLINVETINAIWTYISRLFPGYLIINELDTKCFLFQTEQMRYRALWGAD